jgi:hypothetical protein
MPDTTELSEMGRTLAGGFWADRVVMMAGRLRKREFELDDETRTEAKAVFGQAKRFVDDLIAGGPSLGGKALPENAVELAEDYLAAVRALRRADLQPKDVREFLQRLRGVCEELSEEARTSSEGLRLVLRFFATLSSLAFEQASRDLIAHRTAILPQFV